MIDGYPSPFAMNKLVNYFLSGYDLVEILIKRAVLSWFVDGLVMETD